MAMAWGSRSIPITRRWTNRRRASSLCPPMPRVASTRTAPGSASAGARRSRQRSARTGTWRSAALRSSVIASPPHVLWSCLVVVGRATGAVGGPPPPDQDSRRRSLAPGKCARVAVRDLIVWVSASEESGDHLLGGVGEGVLGGLQVGLPRRGGPDLHPRAGADDGELPVQAGVLAQVGGDGDAALLVGLFIGGPGEQDAGVVTHPAVGDRGFAQLLVDLLELPDRERRDAAFLSFGQHEPARQLVAELGGQDQPALVVQARVVGAEEHAAHRPSRATDHQCAPHYSTFLPGQRNPRHFSPIAWASPQVSRVVRSGGENPPRRADLGRRTLQRAENGGIGLR